jgi:hypothetical protein
LGFIVSSNSGEFGPFFSMKIPCYRSNSYFSGQISPIKKTLILEYQPQNLKKRTKNHKKKKKKRKKELINVNKNKNLKKEKKSSK